MVNWKDEFDKVRKELVEEKKEHVVLKKRMDRLFDIINEIDYEELKKKMKLLDKAEKELVSGKIYEKISKMERDLKNLKEFADKINPVRINKILYENFRKYEKKMDIKEREIVNKLENVSGKVKGYVLKLTNEKKEEIKDEILREFANAINRLGEIEERIMKFEKKLNNLKEEVEISIIDLIKRNKEGIENIEKKFSNYGKEYENMMKEITGKIEEIINREDKKYENIERKLDYVSKVHKADMELIERRFEEMLEKFEKEERKEMEEFEFEEIKMVDERLNELEYKLNRTMDFVINQERQIKELRDNIERNLNSLNKELREIMGKAPVVVE